MDREARNVRGIALIRSGPDPTPLLFLVAAGSALLYWLADAGWAAFLLPAILLVPVAVYLLSANIYLALSVLIVSAAMPRYFIQISGTKARPEHIVTALLCLAAAFIYRRRREPLRWMRLDLLVLAFILTNVFSSVFMSVAPAQTFKWSMQQTLVVLPYFLLRLLAGNRERFRKAVQLMLLAGAVEAAYAVLCFYSYRLLGSEFGVDVGQYGDIPGIYGTQFEANLLGSYCGACLVVMLFMYFQDRTRKLLWGAAITFAGMVISLSRAAVLSTGLAVAVMTIYSLRKRLVDLQLLRKTGLVLVSVTLVMAVSIVPLYVERFRSISISDPTADDDTKVRILTLGAAAERSLEHPLFGTGTNSFQLDFAFSEIGYGDDETVGWIGNTEMRIWHDTGLVGLAIFSAFLVLLLIHGLRVVRANGPPELVALLLAGIVYSISFQATDATVLSFPWIHLGLIGAAVALPTE